MEQALEKLDVDPSGFVFVSLFERLSM